MSATVLAAVSPSTTTTAYHVGSNADWQARSRAAVWHPCTQTIRLEAAPPLPVTRGESVWLYDAEGRRYLDATSSWWVNLFGHAHPALNAALKDQLDRMAHVMLAGCTHAPAVELSERLSALTEGVLGHCFYASDGASAVEIALKMSFHFWRNAGQANKRHFVCVQHGYHGETLGALGVTDVAIFRDAYAPLITPAHIVPSPDMRQAQPGERPADVAHRAADALEALLAERAHEIAAIVIEPLVQCATGMAMHDPVYIERVRALCDRYAVHMVADEIAVGCGRTGTFFACQQAGSAAQPVWPDFLCLSKGISGGYLPLALVMTRTSVYERFHDDDVQRSFLHSHSYTGNPMACRAALATLDLFNSEDVLARNQMRSARMFAALERALADDIANGCIHHLRHRGMIFAVDVAGDQAGQRFSERFHLTARAHGVLMRPIGTTVYLMPPYVISDAEIDWLATQTAEILHATLEGAPA